MFKVKMSCLSSVAVGKIGFETDRAKKQLQDLAKAFFLYQMGKILLCSHFRLGKFILLLRQKTCFPEQNTDYFTSSQTCIQNDLYLKADLRLKILTECTVMSYTNSCTHYKST